MKRMQKISLSSLERANGYITKGFLNIARFMDSTRKSIASRGGSVVESKDRGDVPGWVLVVLMTTGLVTAIWTIAAPKLSSILRNSLDAMNAIR